MYPGGYTCLVTSPRTAEFDSLESQHEEDDSSVRRRAYALRQKLEEVYAKELTDAPIRIDVPKGSYVPRFIPRFAIREERVECRAGAQA